MFVGLCNCDYAALHYHDSNISSPYAATGNAFSIAANRISYIYNLTGFSRCAFLLTCLGPSLALDTACSSSLVALDIATRYMQQGRCNCAVVGGANLLLSPLPTIALAQSGFLAGDGRCKVFSVCGCKIYRVGFRCFRKRICEK